MKKINLDFLISGLIYAFFMLISCIVTMFAEILTVKVFNLFIVTEYHLLTVIRAVVYTVGVSAILSVISYREGYRAAKFSMLSTLIAGAIGSVIHFLFAFLFNFEGFCAGGVRFVTALIKYGRGLNHNSLMDALGRVDFIPFFFMISALYIGLMIVFGKLGEFMRLADRQELTGQQSETDENP